METIGRDLREMQRVPLTAEHVAALRAEGSEAIYPAGTYIVRPGDPAFRRRHDALGNVAALQYFLEDAPGRPGTFEHQEKDGGR